MVSRPNDPPLACPGLEQDWYVFFGAINLPLRIHFRHPSLGSSKALTLAGTVEVATHTHMDFPSQRNGPASEGIVPGDRMGSLL